MASIFSKIVSGEIPCYSIAENDEFLAFLDINPLVKGHVLVIPKIEIDYIFDMDNDYLGRMMIFSKSIAQKIKSKISCKRIGITVIGLEVPHAHIHLIPINCMDDMNFSRSKLNLSPDELSKIQSELTS